MSLGQSLIGSAFLLGTLCLSLATGWRLTARLEHLRGLERWLALATLSTFALILAGVVPAALTILSRPAMLITALALAAATWRLLPVRRRPLGSASPTDEAPPPSSRSSVAVATAAVAVTSVYELARLRVGFGHVPDFIDAVGFHLPGVATWIQTGSLWRVDQFYPGFATAQYPNNGDFLLLTGVLPWRDLALARLVMVPFYVLTGFSSYALALRLRATRAAAATLAATVMTVPYVSSFAYDALPDPLCLAMLGIGLTFLVRHLSSERRSDLLLGGLALGICFGTKWYGLTAVAVIAVVFAVAWWQPWRHPGPALRRLGWLVLTILAGGGIWLVRNLVESDNPIYPKAVRLLGITIFPGSRRDVIDQLGFSIAHYLGQPHVLKEYVYPGFRDAFELGGLVGLFGLAAAVGLLLRRPALPRAVRRPVWLLLATTAGIGVVYIVTPGSAYGPPGLPLGGAPTLRWLMPVLLTGAPVTAWAASRLGAAGLALELAALAGVISGISHGDGIVLGPIAEAVVALAIVAALVHLARRGHRLRRWPGTVMRPRPRAAGVLAMAGALAAAVAVTASTIFALQRSFHRDGYAAYDPTFAYVVQHAPSGHRVGITGEAGIDGLAPVLPLAGPRLGNRIAYVGDSVAHSVELPSRAGAFAAELRRGRYDLLEIGLRDSAGTDAVARRLGFRLLAASPRLALYGLRPSSTVTTRGS